MNVTPSEGLMSEGSLPRLMRTPLFALLGALLLLPAVPAAAAQDAAARIALDVQDLPGDIIVDPRSGPSSVGEREGIDLVRYRQRVVGDDVVMELVFRSTPGEPNASFSAVGQMGERVGQGYLVGLRWNAQGEVPETAEVSYTIGSTPTAQANVTVEGSTVRLRFPLPAEATCMSLLASVEVRAGDVEYVDWLSPEPDPCHADDLLAGAQGACPPAPAPAGRDPVAVEIEDEADDVRSVSMMDAEGAPVDGPTYDIRRVTSAREGDRVVQTVTMGAPREPSEELRIRVVNRLDDERTNGEATFALTPLYWRFHNGSQQDRSHGEFDRDGVTADFATQLEIEEATYTFSWCASLIPDDARCFGIEVIAERVAYLGTGVRDVASATPDLCALAGHAPDDVTPPPADEEPTGDELAEDEAPTGEEAETPFVGLAPLLLGLAAVALWQRRAA